MAGRANGFPEEPRSRGADFLSFPTSCLIFMFALALQLLEYPCIIFHKVVGSSSSRGRCA